MPKRHHTHAKSVGNVAGGVNGIGKDHHHRGKHGATGGNKPHNKVGSAGGTRSKPSGKNTKAHGATPNQKGSRPIRLAASFARRPTVSKRKKISHDTLI